MSGSAGPVIGADRQVWTRWSRPDGSFVDWTPFGGVATSGVEVDLDATDGAAVDADSAAQVYV